MASKYKRSGSPFWWIQPSNGKAFSTKLRHNVPHETQKAADILEAAMKKERQKFSEPERWEFWVPNYIQERYEFSPKSLERYKLRWRSIRAFLSRHNIHYPRQLTFNVVTQYVAWRRTGDRDYGVWPSSKNTAIGDVKFFSMIMRRSIQLGFASANPCEGLGLRKSKPDPKNEITPEHLAVIWDALQSEPQFMRDWFQIAYYTGCRLTECAIPLDCADVSGQFIHFPDTKLDKPFTVPMRDELVPVFKRLQLERGTNRAFDMPPLPGLLWWKFFNRLKLDRHYSFHCLRVTFITRGMESGVPIQEMMKLVNHASAEIHRVYQRWKPEHLRPSVQKLNLPALHKHVASESLDVLSATCPSPPNPSSDP